MIRFIKINNLYDLDNLYNLFITKKYLNKGRIQIGDFYFSISQTPRTCMILIEDLNKRNIANCIYSRDWFESNMLNIIKNIVNNLRKESYKDSFNY